MNPGDVSATPLICQVRDVHALVSFAMGYIKRSKP